MLPPRKDPLDLPRALKEKAAMRKEVVLTHDQKLILIKKANELMKGKHDEQ
jgi:hypothetical protein